MSLLFSVFLMGNIPYFKAYYKSISDTAVKDNILSKISFMALYKYFRVTKLNKKYNKVKNIRHNCKEAVEMRANDTAINPYERLPCYCTL